MTVVPVRRTTPRRSEGGTDVAVKLAPSPAAPDTVAAPCSCGHAHAPPTTMPARQPVLVSGRSLAFTRDGRSILDGVDIDIGAGEIVTLIGPNGAGKTSLVRLLLRLDKPSRGVVTHSPAARIGYVPQKLAIDRAMPLTVERFLTLGQPVSATEIDRCLADVGASRVRGSQLARLSGGELQRVVMARALLRRPTLLVLDEPLRGVDATGEAELYDLIQRLSVERGMGVLLVSHDLHIVMAASDRVVCLNHHVCCSGVPEHVAADPEYVRLFGAEAARALGIYRHHHDHAHDLAGAPLQPPEAKSTDRAPSDAKTPAAGPS